MPQGASERKLEKSLKPHLDKRGNAKEKQEKLDMNTERLEAASHRHAEGQASFRTRNKVAK